MTSGYCLFLAGPVDSLWRSWFSHARKASYHRWTVSDEVQGSEDSQHRSSASETSFWDLWRLKVGSNLRPMQDWKGQVTKAIIGVYLRYFYTTFPLVAHVNLSPIKSFYKYEIPAPSLGIHLQRSVVKFFLWCLRELKWSMAVRRDRQYIS